jgi:hypothetical protein
MPNSTESKEASQTRTSTAAKSTQPVLIRYGIHRLEAKVGGKTVAQIRKLLQQPLNLDPRVIALVNHRQAIDNTILQAGDQLEFVRLAGVKGRRQG